MTEGSESRASPRRASQSPKPAAPGPWASCQWLTGKLGTAKWKLGLFRVSTRAQGQHVIRQADLEQRLTHPRIGLLPVRAAGEVQQRHIHLPSVPCGPPSFDQTLAHDGRAS